VSNSRMPHRADGPPRSSCLPQWDSVSYRGWRLSKVILLLDLLASPKKAVAEFVIFLHFHRFGIRFALHSVSCLTKVY